MSRKRSSSRSAGPASNVRGRTFAFARRPTDESEQTVATQLLERLGAVVVSEVTSELDYLVVFDRRPNRPTSEERRVHALGEAGRSIRVLDRAEFRDLLSPTAEEALALLQGGDEGLEQWRSRRSDVWSRIPIDLSGVDLRGAKLTGIVLYRVKLDRADLGGADLTGSNLDELARVNLDGANLTGAYVPHLTDCSVRRADLSNVRFNPAVVVRTDFTGSKLIRVSGSYTRSEQAVFRDADLTGAMLQNSEFIGADFDAANLTGAFLDDCDLTGATFRGANLAGASLCRAKLVNADLTGADLTVANLAGADLTRAICDRADFTNANLYAARIEALGSGQPTRLVPPPAVAWERVGPNMTHMEELWRQTDSLQTSIQIDADGNGTDFVRLLIDYGGQGRVRGFSSMPHGSHRCQAATLYEAMLELAQRWPGAELIPETLGFRGPSRRIPKGLADQALAAWYEAFGFTPPTPAEHKSRQAVHRQRLLAVLRSGPEGVGQWNDLPSEALIRAGHFRRVDLTGCDLRRANLSRHLGTLFGELDFGGADFSGADLTGGDLQGGSFVKARFRGATLAGVCLLNSDLRHADFEAALLNRCDLHGVRAIGRTSAMPTCPALTCEVRTSPRQTWITRNARR